MQQVRDQVSTKKWKACRKRVANPHELVANLVEPGLQMARIMECGLKSPLATARPVSIRIDAAHLSVCLLVAKMRTKTRFSKKKLIESPMGFSIKLLSNH